MKKILSVFLRNPSTSVSWASSSTVCSMQIPSLPSKCWCVQLGSWRCFGTWKKTNRKDRMSTIFLQYLIVMYAWKPQTTIYKWLFQLDDSQSLHRRWLFHQTSIFKWFFGVPGVYIYIHMCVCIYILVYLDIFYILWCTHSKLHQTPNIDLV